MINSLKRLYNKKGQIESEAIMLVWRLVLIGAVVFFVAITVGSIYLSKHDVRKAEASILANKITDCITSDGIVKSNFDIKPCFDLDSEIYVSVDLSSLESNFSKKQEIENKELAIFCNLPSSQRKYPSCINQKSYVLIQNENSLEKAILEITIGVKKYDENV